MRPVGRLRLQNCFAHNWRHNGSLVFLQESGEERSDQVMLAARNFSPNNVFPDLEVLALVFRDLNIQSAPAHDLHIVYADYGQFVVLGEQITKGFEIGNYQLRPEFFLDLLVFGKIGSKIFRRRFQVFGKGFQFGNCGIFISQMEAFDLVYPARKTIVKQIESAGTGNDLYIVVLLEQVADNYLAARCVT
jgi:hypothetical protein